MTVTARMRCHFVQRFNVDKPDEYRVVNLNPVYSSDPDSPNYSFSKWTPSGQISLTITNPDAFSQFAEGKSYNLTFEEYIEPALNAPPAVDQTADDTDTAASDDSVTASDATTTASSDVASTADTTATTSTDSTTTSAA
jgi:hypothetical protein